MKKIKRIICMGLCLTILCSQSVFATQLTTQPDITVETVSTFDADSAAESDNTADTESVSNDINTIESESTSESTATIDTDIIPESDCIINTYATSDPVTEFVERLYEVILDRSADAIGLADWVSQLKAGSKAGADIIAGFIFSDEFTNKNYSDSEFITVLYHAILSRDPDETGLTGWTNDLADGLSRYYVCAGFVYSTEFSQLCASYGIQPGILTLTTETDLNPKVTKFVSRLYKLLLNRTPDTVGLKDWVGKLVSKKYAAADIVCGIVFSTEFTGYNHSNSDYIDLLYNAMFDRGSDAVGKADWMDALENGMSRTFVLRGFVQSNEFIDLANQYNIDAGVINLTEARDFNRKITAYIQAAYNNCFGRFPSSEELNSWAQKLNAHTMLPSQFLHALIFSTESASHTGSNADFARVLFRTVLQRELPDSELNQWIADIKSSSRENIFNSITSSAEYKTLCSNYDLNYSLADGWVSYNGNTYYYYNGSPLTGWQRLNGNVYYFIPTQDGKRAEGWNYIDNLKYYFNSNGVLVQNVDSLIGKQSSYYVKVNTATNIVTVYARDGANGYIIPVKNMLCSCGLASTPTIKGTYTIQRMGYWWELMGPVWGQYVSRISGSYLFHSAWYYVNGNRYTLSVSEYRKLGNNASHGCVRMTVGDAKWIFDNCNGSTVTVYSSYDKGTQFDKPTRPNPVVISGDRGYDPTDPYFN